MKTKEEEIEELRKELSIYGNIEVIKDGTVFTLFMTKDKHSLANSDNVLEINDKVFDYLKRKTVFIEVLLNEENFLLLIVNK